MAYSELIKDLKRIRIYMRDFYVYGLKSREEFDAKSARSYDNERRRIESWLGNYLSFRQDASGKRMFLSVDSRSIPANPLYRAFKAKSFTRGDIVFHFYIMDMLADGEALCAREITAQLCETYLSPFRSDYAPDESTVRKKLQEYTALGLLTCEKEGREVRYRRTDAAVNMESWKEAAAFFSEAAPLGVIGSYLLDGLTGVPSHFRWKHHYMLHALDSEVLLTLLDCMSQKRFAVMQVANPRKKGVSLHEAIPLKIFVSTQTGRQYLLAKSVRFHKLLFFRLDLLHSVTLGELMPPTVQTNCLFEAFAKNLWGVSTGGARGLDHIEMTIHVDDGEAHIVHRLEREKRCGTVTAVDAHTYLFCADVYDATEMLPWIRTFIGRIKCLSCSSKSVTDTFYADLAAMRTMYGGDGDAVS